MLSKRVVRHVFLDYLVFLSDNLFDSKSLWEAVMPKVVRFILVFTAVFALLSGCGKEKPLTSINDPKFSSEDFFPTEIGTRWTYKITIGKVEPLNTRTIFWPNDIAGQASTKSFGHLQGLSEIENPSGQTFELIISVKGNREIKVESTPKDAIELEIEKDDIGVYFNSSDVFWTIDNSELYKVEEAVTFKGESTLSPGGDLGISQKGLSGRIIFFTDKPDTSLSFQDDDPGDSCTFKGFEKGKMHFLREVKAQDSKDPHSAEICKGYTEDTWFEKEKGLVRLEQKIDNITSMTWELAEFTKG